MQGLVVLFEDPAMLVVDKPPGVHTAPLRAGEEGTLLQMVLQAYPEVAAVPGVKTVEPGLVHRLDRETSGLVLVARTAAAFRSLRASFSAGAARKTYVAVCFSEVPEKTLTLESSFAPYGPGRRKVRVVLRQAGTGGAATRTVYRTDAEVIAREGGRALVRAAINRGFRHQVRAHLAYLGFPIYGDPLYGASVPGVPAGLEQRMYLHAARIELPHPETGAPLVVESRVPGSFTVLMEEETR
jgi:23S rRNA pseudouridine1911/1915/1917 synthase